jgi:hypothetical protein
MANYQKLQVGTALNIVPSDDANIPFPNVVEEGVSTGAALNQLVDANAEFITKNVKTGDIVYNASNASSATVISVIDENTLELNANNFLINNGYYVYANNTKEACVLYIGTGGNLRVLTASGQDVTFANVLGGTFLPVQVLKVFAEDTAASNIVALW